LLREAGSTQGGNPSDLTDGATRGYLVPGVDSNAPTEVYGDLGDRVRQDEQASGGVVEITGRHIAMGAAVLVLLLFAGVSVVGTGLFFATWDFGGGETASIGADGASGDGVVTVESDPAREPDVAADLKAV